MPGVLLSHSNYLYYDRKQVGRCSRILRCKH
jgi:hypothetical protein